MKMAEKPLRYLSIKTITDVQRIYLFSFFWMFLVLIPVAVPFYLELGLTMHQIFQVQAVFAVTVVIFEVPTGYFGDIVGRRASIIIGAALSGLGFSILAYGQNFTSILIFEVIAGLAQCFVSGADVALLYDHHDEKQRTHATSALGNLQLANQLGESTAAIIGGAIAMISLKAVAYTHAMTSWIPLIVGIGFKDRPYEKFSKESHRKNFLEVIRHIHANSDRIVPWTFLNGVIWGLSTFFVVWMLQKYWQDQGVPLAWFGFLWAGLNLSTGLVGKKAHSWENLFGARKILFLIMILPVLGYLGMGLFGGWVGVSCGILFYASRGLGGVILKDALNARTPAKFRNTINSLSSLCFRLGFALFGPGLGMLVDWKGMPFSLLVLAAVFAIFIPVIGLPLIRKIELRDS